MAEHNFEHQRAGTLSRPVSESKAVAAGSFRSREKGVVRLIRGAVGELADGEWGHGNILIL
jgi:hypothetical protein